jgi:hypothetical protein
MREEPKLSEKMKLILLTVAIFVGLSFAVLNIISKIQLLAMVSE